MFVDGGDKDDVFLLGRKTQDIPKRPGKQPSFLESSFLIPDIIMLIVNDNDNDEQNRVHGLREDIVLSKLL